MRPFRYLLLAAALLAGPLAAGQSPLPVEGLLAYSGEAIDLDGRHFIYGERHFVRFAGGSPLERVVLYTCADSRPFARKIVSYAPGRFAPDFAMQDSISGVREGLATRGADRQIYFRRGASEREEKAPLGRIEALVADAGFDEFVRARWEALVRGERVRLDFVVPSRLGFASFKLRRLRSEVIAGVPAEVFRLSLSGMWAFIAPHIDVYYTSRDRVLLRYEGITNVRDARGDNYEVRIEFPASQRRVDAGVEALERARREPLVDNCG
jgi:hypothetical protein